MAESWKGGIHCPIRIVVILVLTWSVLPWRAEAGVTDDLLADFHFGAQLVERTGRGAAGTVSNASFSPEGLLLNRGYENGGEGYIAEFQVPGLRPRAFTVAVEFLPLDFAKRSMPRNISADAGRLVLHLLGFRVNTDSDNRNVITAGKYWRWLGFNHGAGHLQLTLNNQEYCHDFTNTVLTTGQWHTLACAFDLEQRTIRVVVDGRLLPPVHLPADLQLRVLSSRTAADERNFTFANYSNGQAFCGYVGRLRVFDGACSPEELIKFGAIPDRSQPGKWNSLMKWFALPGLVLLLSGLFLMRRPRRRFRHFEPPLS